MSEPVHPTPSNPGNPNATNKADQAIDGTPEDVSGESEFARPFPFSLADPDSMRRAGRLICNIPDSVPDAEADVIIEAWNKKMTEAMNFGLPDNATDEEWWAAKTMSDREDLGLDSDIPEADVHWAVDITSYLLSSECADIPRENFSAGALRYALALDFSADSKAVGALLANLRGALGLPADARNTSDDEIKNPLYEAMWMIGLAAGPHPREFLQNFQPYFAKNAPKLQVGANSAEFLQLLSDARAALKFHSPLGNLIDFLSSSVVVFELGAPAAIPDIVQVITQARRPKRSQETGN